MSDNHTSIDDLNLSMDPRLSRTSQYWVVVPAAGVGTRMEAAIPKQYLKINGVTLLEHTLERLLQLPRLAGIVLVTNPMDEYWEQLPLARNPLVHVVDGGQERCDSVLNGLRFLQFRLDKLDWVLVHDAARPCVTLDSIEGMIDELQEHLVGGLLGVPVSDTLKRLDDCYGVSETVDREGLWQAQTPQMFRFGVLKESLEKAAAAGFVVTDEASAVEHSGYCPRMVEGRQDNIKITRPEDLWLAESILQRQKTTCQQTS